ncbi:hypothetical protein M2O40_003896 [Kluyvera ascorbata]
MYGHLNIKSLKWDIVSLETSEFCGLGAHATVPEFVLDVSEDSKGDRFEIDGREEVAEHWRKFGTWDERPMFIDRLLVFPGENGLHLMESHKRLGTLLGAIKYGFVALADTHEIYLATHI